ncbi:hypothetical protein C8N35_104245 [Breoghania corrubedonensis]|uniref:GDSL-like lipase/acylhydrolase family protein n=1 Tax=Breoghania corrubedonensis TaxID=665038 RepID=A0A2T5VA43_9HYPH|nr:hypothetical protein [Breoghania corrubedonensis]PTW60620.1 hypothetical protein C8N35_104245 [Breoghania corrubedonensis]
MRAYSEEFADSGNINWLPYTMYFHPYNYESDVVNTDATGFRYSHARGSRYSLGDRDGIDEVRVIAGSSTVFGIGASADRHTLASRLSENDPRAVPWINFGGRSFNSTQEMILFSLNRQHLPKVKEIVLFSGFNDLGLARLPARLRQEHGAFFMCNDFFDAMGGRKQSRFSSWFGGGRKAAEEEGKTPTHDEQIDYAARLVLRNLANWRAMANDMGAELTFVLQPLANWVRKTGTAEEEALFAELERKGRFAENYGDILEEDAYRAYRDRLRSGTQDLGVRFIDIVPQIRQSLPEDFWLFVDRIHFTDQGHDWMANLLLKALLQEKG